jgi:antirestriction protein ArdC
VDYRQRLTNQLVKAIEEHGQLPWKKWDGAALRPFNPKRGERHKGGNIITLLLAQLERGSNDPRWMTMAQANKAGYWIRKGAAPVYIEYWDFGKPLVPPKADDSSGVGVDVVPEPEGEVQTGSTEGVPVVDAVAVDTRVTRTRPHVFYAQMFNGEDVLGLPAFERKLTWEPNELAAELLAASHAAIEHKALSTGAPSLETSAHYTPSTDTITLPLREQFKSAKDYYATALHELAHWTGHASRLGRDLTGEFGSAEYAQEELRAEIASMYLCAALGIDGDVQNHASYTATWLTKLKGNKQEMFRAAKDAERIVDFIFDLVPELRAKVDASIRESALPDSASRKVVHSGVSKDLPNFIPADAKPAVVADAMTKPKGEGRDDPRWGDFERLLRASAIKHSVREPTLEHALKMLVVSFTEAMDKAEEQGFGAQDMNRMLADRVVVDMLNIDRRNDQWADFVGKVHKVGDTHVAPEAITLALSDLHIRYVAVLDESARQNWAVDTAKRAIEQVVFGDSPRKINLDYVQKIVRECEASRVFLGSDADDFVLSVASVNDALGGDELILQPSEAEDYLLDDAEVPGI